jgi:hypothetical protein
MNRPSIPTQMLLLAASLAGAAALHAADTLTSLWQLAPGDREYVTTSAG